MTKLDRILASAFMTARYPGGGGVVLMLFMVPVALFIGLAVLLVKALVRGGAWFFRQAKEGGR